MPTAKTEIDQKIEEVSLHHRRLSAALTRAQEHLSNTDPDLLLETMLDGARLAHQWSLAINRPVRRRR